MTDHPRIAPHDEYDHLRESARAGTAAAAPPDHLFQGARGLCTWFVYDDPRSAGVGRTCDQPASAHPDPVALAHLAALMHDLDALADRRRFEDDYTMTADALGPITRAGGRLNDDPPNRADWLPLELCTGDTPECPHYYCPDGWHAGDAPNCSCTPDCALGDDE